MLQADLDRYASIHNNSKPRADRKKRMPCEIPSILLEHPDAYGPFFDYKVSLKTFSSE
jgi:hypothetical protein